MKRYKLNNIQKRQQQQKLTNMTSNFQYKKSLWTSTWHKKKLLSSICISHDVDMTLNTCDGNSV